MANQTTTETMFGYLLASRHSCLWVTTTEERRVERLLMSRALKQAYAVRYWDCATGVTAANGDKISMDMDLHPSGIFQAIRGRSARELWILRDLSPWLDDPSVLRGLKSLARDLKDETSLDKIAAIVVLDSNGTVPESLRGSVTVLDWPLPTREEASAIVDQIAAASKVELNGNRERILDAATGLPADDVADAIGLSIVRTKAETGEKGIKPGDVIEHKKRVIDREPSLTWYPPEELGLDAIGGLDLLKGWLRERSIAFSKEARAYGLPSPRGLLICGVPGTGKSLAAKAIATAWGGLPLLRLDLGALRGSLVGQSEAAIRRALKMAEAIAPCVVLVDEIEKSLAGSDSRGDGGVAADALGTLLTWLQDHSGSVFVVATANRVDMLPPELSRKGRFDEVFFVDLPTLSERAEILRASLAKHKQGGEHVDELTVSQRTEGFSGAEIAELVPSAMFRAFADGARPIQTADILAAIATTVPVSRSAAERIEYLRTWAKSRARPASSPEQTALATTTAHGGYGRVLDLGDA